MFIYKTNGFIFLFNNFEKFTLSFSNLTIISYLPFIKHIMYSSQDIIQLFN